MDSARRLALLFSLLAIAVFAGCGGDDSGDEGGGSGGGSSASGDSGGSSAPAGVAKPGTELKIGDTAQVQHRPLTAPPNSKKTYKVEATVVKLEKGSIDDFEDVNLDAKEREATPYYLTVRLRNVGEQIPVKPSDDPDAHFNAIDDRGQEQSNVIFIGEFERCQEKDAPKPFTEGESFESCLVYLVPGGGSIREITWTGTIDYISKPVVWK